MADQTGLKTPPEEVKTQAGAEPTPDKKEPTPPAVTQPKVEPEVKPQGAEGELPPETADRTREQFDKLKESNKRLYEANKILQTELGKRMRSEQTFAPIQQPGVVQPTFQPGQVQPTEPKIEQFIETDPITGEQYVDENKLRGAIADANVRATRAESAVQQYIKRQQEEEDMRQTKETFTAYPELNPENVDTFDKELHKRTRSILLDSMMNPNDYDGTPLTFKEAADLAQKQTAKEANATEKKVEEQRQQALEEKEQASLTAQGQAGTPPPSQNLPEDLAELTRRTRIGDTWALAQRLQNTPHTGTPSSSVKKEEV